MQFTPPKQRLTSSYRPFTGLPCDRAALAPTLHSDSSMQEVHMNLKIGTAVLFLAAIACDGSTGPAGGGKVAIKFGAGSSSAVRGNLMASSAPGISSDLTVTGTNGTIDIQDIRFIVEEIKLKSTEGTGGCAENENEDRSDDNVLVRADDRQGGNGAENENDDCEFEGGPFIVDLPLDGNTTIATENVPPGTYDHVSFKVDDLEGGNDDEADDSANAPNLLNQIRTVYPNFPSRASMVVKGTQNGTPFTVYFRSKMRINQVLDPPLTVPGTQVLTVKLDPSMWFKNGNQVLNLAALNGRLVDIGNGFGNGIKGAHRGDD